MSPIYPLSVHRRIERQWAERIKSPRQIRGEIVVASEQTLQRVFNNEVPLIPSSNKKGHGRIQHDRSPPRD
jgi:hypothetical protein